MKRISGKQNVKVSNTSQDSDLMKRISSKQNVKVSNTSQDSDWSLWAQELASQLRHLADG